MAGGKSYRELGLATVVPAKPESSLWWNKIYEESPWVGEPMPPREEYDRLEEEMLNWIRTWIHEGGAPDPGQEDECF
jgi:hypothetical protein